ncbi:MAG: mRNA interferase RelE/StbE [Thermoplasmata archaeon]|jgi:mRNA interferase RelE/StbE|nr:mRNA interferase RelE/StbE [Thermoplasmata archaeon]
MKSHPLGNRGPPKYAVKLHEKALDEFEALPDAIQERMEAGIDELQHDPFRPRPGVDVLKLEDVGGDDDLYRLRVGDYRAIYTVDKEGRVVLVVVVDDREIGYTRLVAITKARLG